MTKLRKLFGGINMTWLKVIIFSVITGVYTGLINQVPALSNTSFTDIAVNCECWIVFAIFVVVNCNKWWEAMLKCFVFFLISQPLVYLVEVPFLGWEVFRYYGYWFIFTLLTIPGSFIAYWVTKKNILSSLILSVATGLLVYFGVYYLNEAIYDFPHHILSAVFCFVSAVMLILILLPKLNTRLISFAVTGVVLLVAVFFTFVSPTKSSTYFELDDNTNWSCQTDDDNLVDVEISDGYRVTLSASRNGKTILKFKGENGKTVTYDITVDDSTHMVTADKVN